MGRPPPIHPAVLDRICTWLAGVMAAEPSADPHTCEFGLTFFPDEDDYAPYENEEFTEDGDVGNDEICPQPLLDGVRFEDLSTYVGSSDEKEEQQEDEKEQVTAIKTKRKNRQVCEAFGPVLAVIS